MTAAAPTAAPTTAPPRHTSSPSTPSPSTPIHSAPAPRARRRLAPLAAIALAAALLSGCGAPSAPPQPVESSSPVEDGAGSGGENVFEGTWTMTQHAEVLGAAALADLLEEEAEIRGPAELSVDVECADGIDTVTGDTTASCTAFADEGVEHPWAITAAPADVGMTVEVENAG